MEVPREPAADLRAPSRPRLAAGISGGARTAEAAGSDLFVNQQKKGGAMSAKEMERASFKELVEMKIKLRRRGLKDGVRYANLDMLMKRRFGRS